MEQLMLAVAVAVITAVEAEPIMAVVVAGLRTLTQADLARCTRRHIHLQQPMDH
jgi:hypothetical protein